MRERLGSPAFAALAALMLIGALFVVRFVVHMGYPLRDPAVWLLVAGYAGLGAVFGLLAFFGHRLRMIICFVGVLVLLTYSGVLLDPSLQLSKLLQSILGGFDIGRLQLFILSFALFLYLCGIILVVVFITLKTHVPNVLLVVSLTTLLSTLILPGRMDIKVTTTGALPETRADLPPFLVIILDGQLGIAGLPPGMPESRRAGAILADTLADFKIFETAYSR